MGKINGVIDSCGTEMVLQEHILIFKKGQWYTISMYIKLNSSKDVSDGVVKLLIDGKEYISLENQRPRGTNTDETLVSKFVISTFHGGSDDSWSPSKTVYAYYNNFQVVEGL